MYEEFRMKLLTSLPMNDSIFIGLLRKQDLFPGDLEEQVQIRGTKAEKTDWFLNHAIERSLCVNIMKPLHNLLTVMSDNQYLNNKSLSELAAKVKQQLDIESSLMSSCECIRMYELRNNIICIGNHTCTHLSATHE